MRAVTAAVLAGAAVLVAACELEVTADVALERDGRGSVAVTFAFDEAMLSALDAAAVDPTAELAAAAAGTDGWELARTATAAGGLEVTVTHVAADPDALASALAELSAGLTADDPALVVDLDLDVDEDGATAVAGQVALRPPAGPGLLAGPEQPDVPDAERMRALTAEHVSAALTVTLPARASSADGDELDGRTVRWVLEPDQPRTVTARASAPGPFTVERVAVALAGLLLVVAVAGTTWAWRRRRA